MQLKDLRAAYELAKKLEVSLFIICIVYYSQFVYNYLFFHVLQSDSKWKMLADLALTKCQFGLALECLHLARDYSGLLLVATSAGDAETLDKLSQVSAGDGQHNIAFMAHLLLGRLEEALGVLVDTGRLPEAAFFARTYLPSEVSRCVLITLTIGVKSVCSNLSYFYGLLLI